MIHYTMGATRTLRISWKHKVLHIPINTRQRGNLSRNLSASFVEKLRGKSLYYNLIHNSSRFSSPLNP
jgi:hypothetical protein